jgi:uncharacterized membrane protein
MRAPGVPEAGAVPGASAASGCRTRFGGLDTLRGVAIAWMVSFHFCFDLNWFGVARFDFYRSPWWLDQRIAIVSLFLLCAGLSQAWGDARERAPRAFWKRWAQIFGCGLLVGVGSYLAFPGSFIYFGILQGVAAMLLLHRYLGRRLGAWIVLLVPLLLVAPTLWGSAAFDGRWLNWTGLIAHKPITEDYVPLLPWYGVFALGAGIGALLRRDDFRLLARLPTLSPLAWLGRRPLTIYMVHQPLLIAALWLALKAHGAMH